MIKLVPRYLERLDPNQDRTQRMFERLSIAGGDLDTLKGSEVAIRLTTDTRSRRLLVSHLADLLLRMQPLVRAVYVESPDQVGDLTDRFPVQLSRGTARFAISVAVGRPVDTADLVIDSAGWAGVFGGECQAEDDGNPLGALAMAQLAAGEIFKLAFRAANPARPLSRRFVMSEGPFSFWDYTRSITSPTLPAFEIDAILVGAGGVGAGVIEAFAALGDWIRGRLVLVDHDRLDIYNLNRVLYARLEEVEQMMLKVESAHDYLRRHAPHLVVRPVSTLYRDFASLTPRRADRRFPLVITGLDNDEARWEVQRDLPLILVDGSTGSQANCRVERVWFGEAGCLGCSRAPQHLHRPDPMQCDDPPDLIAPSISFLSAFAGTLCAAEALKAAIGAKGLKGYFEHNFVYPPNPDLTGIPALNEDCPVACSDPGVRRAFNAKWAIEPQE